MDKGNRGIYLVNYDIRDPGRWRRVYKTMNGYGERLQYSLFRCWLTPTGMEKMRHEIEKVLDDSDSFMIIRLGVGGKIIERKAKETWENESGKRENYDIL